jgi:hypothetical protein
VDSAGVALPRDRAALLEQAGQARTSVYHLARACVEDLEAAAPWALLYVPVGDPRSLALAVAELVRVIQGIPDRVEELVGGLPPVADTSDLQSEEIGFLLQSIHHMAEWDLEQVEGTLNLFATARGASQRSAGRTLCELAADLKGKYGSALMGAAASIVAQGRWNGAAIEPMLFPEKADEFVQSRILVDLLRDTLAAVQDLPSRLSLADLAANWARGERVDEYALVDLVGLRARIGRLLQARHRRSLYSGDYHRLSWRERQLAARLQELERLHHWTWEVDASTTAHGYGDAFGRLVGLLHELAAVLDVGLLKELIGEEPVTRLHGRLTAGERGDSSGVELEDRLLALLAEDDLRLMLEGLLGAVQRRAALSTALSAAATPSTRPPVREPPIAAPPPQPPAPAPRPAAAPPPAVGQPAAGRPPSPRPAAASVTVDLEEVRRQVAAHLDRLLEPSNPDLKSLRLTQQLLAKRTRVPPAMLRSMHPFVGDIATRLAPALARLAPYRGISAETVRLLEARCAELLAEEPTPKQMIEEFPGKLDWLLRFLEQARTVIRDG